MPLVSFNRVGKRYPAGYEALRDASFTIEAGDFAFLTGHSGAGKTTALKLIPAIERATTGAVLVNGQNVGALREAALPFLRRTLGLVFQDQNLLHDRNVFENAMLPLAICGEPPREAARRVRAALDKVGLAGREKAMPVMLSGGEQQRLCIARAVVNRPGILLADEPTANLDSAAAGAVMEIFRAFNQVGVTVLVATHDAALVERFGTRAVRLDHGRVLNQ
ncbi:MAG: ATP-binding cassette domain-containing protein [Burkholderiales bacterium]